jgi:hypothetical protein
MIEKEYYYTTLYAFKLDFFIIEGTFKVIIQIHSDEAPHYYLQYFDYEKGLLCGMLLGVGEEHFRRTFGGREMLYRPSKQYEVAKALLLGL